MYPGRTTIALVGGIVETDPSTWPDITPFIDAANELVTELCVDQPALNPSTTFVPYSTHRLELIERWLSAHIYCMGPDPRVTSEKAGPVSESLEHKAGFILNGSAYGQMAMFFDTKGYLASLNNVLEKLVLPKKAGVIYLGTNPRRLHSQGGYGPVFTDGED